MAEYGREQRNQLSRAIANSEAGSRQLRGIEDNRFVNYDDIVQRKLEISGEPDDIEEGKENLNEAYKIELPSTTTGELKYDENGKDSYGNPQYSVLENPRLDPAMDGIGSHLIGKIIDEGDVHIYFGEESENFAAPANEDEVQKADRGEPCSSRILLKKGASVIELIHELIHSYHFAFDPWTIEQKNAPVNDGDWDIKVSAEEISTVGLGEWKNFELTENAFRRESGLSEREHYGDEQSILGSLDSFS